VAEKSQLSMNWQIHCHNYRCGLVSLHTEHD